MKKRNFVLSMSCMMLFGFSVCAGAAETETEPLFSEQKVKVIADGVEAGEMDLRFYEATPNVPYLGIGTCSEYVFQRPLKLEKKEDGTVVFENEIGEEAVCDPDAGVITVADWNGFFDLPLPLEDKALGWKDTATRFIRITDVEFEGEAAPVTLDLGGYGIRMYADDTDVYLPVSTLSNIMTDIATNHLLYNGEKLYIQRALLSGGSVAGLYETERLKAELEGKDRPEDLAQQCYADLCFNIDSFYGHPGKAPLEEAVAEYGLEKALLNLGKKGEKLIRKLKSRNLPEYMSGLNELLMVYLGDGHTLFLSGSSVIAENEESAETVFGIPVMGLEFTADLLSSPIYLKQTLHETISLQRQKYWGTESYREYDNTAIIRLDSFMPDEAGWQLYYAGEGEIPQDCLGTVLTGLRKASENPEIENVIFDLSCNSGGSPDVMMSILAVTTGQTQLYGVHKITDRKMTFTFDADTNLDGVYDEKDRELKYDFNYGVLVTRHAFSCGNLFPIIIQEAGAVLIGEPSSGGSCCVQVGADAEGFSYMMSSAQWQLTDSGGDDVEGGCRIDLPIEADRNKVADSVLGFFGVDEGMPGFRKFFDDAYLSDLMNGYFQAETEEDIAA